jgi:hypothetical protein
LFPFKARSSLQPTSVTCFAPKAWCTARNIDTGDGKQRTSTLLPTGRSPQKRTRAGTRVHANAETPTPCRAPDDRSNRVTRARAAAASPFPGERSKPKRPRQASAARAPSVRPSVRVTASLPPSLSCHATGTCGPSWTVALHRSGSFIVPPCHHIACRVARSSRRITAATPLIHSSSSRAEPPRSSQGSSETPRRQANPTSQAWSNVHLDEPRVPGAGGRSRGAAAAEGARGRERRLCPQRARRRPAEDGDRRAHQVTSRACDPSAPPFFSL